MLLPRNSAFKNNLLVPYQDPLKFGLSANKTTLPLPIFETIRDADDFKYFSIFFFEIYPSMWGSFV